MSAAAASQTKVTMAVRERSERGNPLLMVVCGSLARAYPHQSNWPIIEAGRLYAGRAKLPELLAYANKLRNIVGVVNLPQLKLSSISGRDY